MPRTPLITPGSVRGFASALSPSALPKGLVSNLYDFRLDQGVLRVRWGSVTLLANVSGANEFRGAFETVQNGAPTLFWAGRSGGKTLVAKSTDHGATWTTITPSSGTYGDTRFPFDGWLTWALVNDEGTDVLVMQNGVDDPRVYDGTVTAITPAVTLAPLGVVKVSFLSDSNFSGTIAPTSSAHITPSIVSTATGYYVNVQITAGVTSAETAVLSKTGVILPVSGLQGQFALLMDEPDGLWQNLKIEASLNTGTGGPWYVVYNPATTPIVTERAAGTAYLVGAPTLANVPAGDIVALRFSYLGDDPGATKNIKLLLLSQAGYAPGGTNFAASYASGGGRVGGPGTVFTNPQQQVANGLIVPVSPLFGYEYEIEVTTPASLPGFVNKLIYYRNDLGTSGYYRFRSRSVVPSTTYTTSEGNSAPLSAIDYTKPLPRADTVSLPKGGPMASVNGRLMIGSGDRFYYSEAGNPFAFALTVQFDANGSPLPDSAGSFSKPGERFTAIAAVGSVDTGAESLGTPRSGAIAVYPITNRWTYVLSGFDAVSLNKTTKICVGSRSPYSLDTTAGGFYFLDSERQIRSVFGTDSKAISKNLVDDKLRGIPDASLAMAWGGYLDGRYRLAYTGVGLNRNFDILVWNESFGWESNDRRPSYPAIAILPYYDVSQSRTRLLSCGTTQLAELDVPGLVTDFGGPTIATVELPEQRFWPNSINVKGAAFIADADATGKAIYSFTAPTGNRIGVTVFPDVSMAGRKGGARIYARTTTGLGTDALSMQPSLTLQCKGGTRLYQLEVEMTQGTDAVTP